MLCLLILIKHLLLPRVRTRLFFPHFFTIFCVVICFAPFYSKSLELKHTSIPFDLNLRHSVTHFQTDHRSFHTTSNKPGFVKSKPSVNPPQVKSVCDANLTWWDRYIHAKSLSRPSGRDFKEEVPSNNLGRWLNEPSMQPNQIWSVPVDFYFSDLKIHTHTQGYTHIYRFHKTRIKRFRVINIKISELAIKNKKNKMSDQLSCTQHQPVA